MLDNFEFSLKTISPQPTPVLFQRVTHGLIQDLFDVLDADMSGELEFEEMIDGLLKCRGPASKTDIIAIRRNKKKYMLSVCFNVVL